MPRRFDALDFWWRARLLGLLAWACALWRREPCWRPGEALVNGVVLAEVRSPLWTDGRPDEFVLVAGKVHNLRLALRAFDGVVVPAGAVLSFWQQLGRPTR